MIYINLIQIKKLSRLSVKYSCKTKSRRILKRFFLKNKNLWALSSFLCPCIYWYHFWTFHSCTYFLDCSNLLHATDNIIEKLCNTIVLLHIKHVYVWGWSPWILYLSNPIVQKLNNGQYRYTTVWCAASDQTYDSGSYRTTFLLRFLFSLLKAHFMQFSVKSLQLPFH